MLRMDGVFKSFGDHQVLRGMSLGVRRGEVYGFVGGNGAGKTTSMRIMLGVTAPDRGVVTVDDAPLDDEARARIGYMPEERGLYAAMGLADQLQFFAELHGADRASAARASLYWLDRFGLADRAGSKLEDLSLGNQQRVQLAAALVHEPDVLVLDEPFSGLDPLAVDVMADVLLEEARRGVPVIFSSHQLDLVERLCDRVGIVRDGTVAAEGTVDELAARAGAQLLLRTDTSAAQWLADVPTRPGTPGGWVEQLGLVEGGVRLRLHDGLDSQLVLHAALRHGAVLDFQRWRPSLADHFRAALEPATSEPASPGSTALDLREPGETHEPRHVERTATR